MSLEYECYFGNIPEKFKSELIELYESPFCTIEYNQSSYGENNLNCFSIHDENRLIHLILFTIDRKNKTVNILNRLFEIDIKYLNLFSYYIFHRKLHINKIEVNQLIKPILQKQTLPCICKPYDEDYIIKLPTSNSEYFSNLSPNMRRHTKNYISKIVRTFGSYSFSLFEKKEIPESVLNKIFDMNYLRMKKKNIEWGYDSSYIESLKKFLLDFGFVSVLEINGEIVAGLIMYSIKNKFFVETTSSNPEYDRNNVGHTCFFQSIQSCIDRKGKEIHLLWGNSPYKQRFLAERLQLYSVVVFRTNFLKQKHKFIYEYLPYLSVKYILKLTKRRIKKMLGQKVIENLKKFRIKKNKIVN